MQDKIISGFSKKDKKQKVQWLADNYFPETDDLLEDFQIFSHPDEDQQKIFDGFSENTISNFFMPYGIAPNFKINDRIYAVPMVIEESSVVAAASSAAKFWLNKGGFQTEILSTVKLGQLHFSWAGPKALLKKQFSNLEQVLRQEAAPITANMEKRGGGVLDIELLDFTDLEADYYQLKVKFETCDSMGANFINSVLESFGGSLVRYISESAELGAYPAEIIMAILSNYTPECMVRAKVSCPLDQLENACQDMSGEEFAQKFYKAVRIAHIDAYRATTHNKGIFNGVDAVVLATGNDFRAIEACGHTYAAASGQYKSLSHCEIKDGNFYFWLDLPLAVGTVGGLTKLHPLAKKSLQLLGNPSAEELMSVIAATGLAQNFAALRSLVTTGIQKGHMKMHLMNILNHLKANAEETQQAQVYFEQEVISFNAVRDYLGHLRANGVK